MKVLLCLASSMHDQQAIVPNRKPKVTVRYNSAKHEV